MKIPKPLERKLHTLSVTVQELVCNIVLAIEGLEAEPQRKAQTEYETADSTKKATRLLNEQLKGFIEGRRIDPEDAAIAFAAISGRSTREVAEFFSMNQLYAMRRLCALRKQAAGWKPSKRRRMIANVVQLAFSFMLDPSEDDIHVLEIFSEAQRAR